MIEIILTAVILIALTIASYTDIKTREVPDWLNYGLIISGLGIRLIYSIIKADWTFFFYGASGALLFLIIAYIMFYTAQWGGGDSKMLIGLGALIGFNFSFNSMLITLVINILLVGAVYGLIWSIALVILNFRKFSAEAKKLLRNKYLIIFRRILLVVLLLSFAFIIITKDMLLGIMLISLLAVILLTFYLWILVKAVENVCMLKHVTPDKLTEGDWIAKDVRVNNEYICGPKDLGIEKEQIKKLIKLKEEGKVDKVLMKTGLPFIPSFLIAYIVSLVWGNLFLLII
tara:strand:+ start:10219 stop:11079 length:861 start_codon:yes stop_codon:yes gene_type:complete